MIKINRSGTYNFEHSQAFEMQPKDFSAHNDGEKHIIQQITFITTRHQGHTPFKIQQKAHLGPTRGASMVHRTIS